MEAISGAWAGVAASHDLDSLASSVQSFVEAASGDELVDDAPYICELIFGQSNVVDVLEASFRRDGE